jgi:hypothetical protein
LGGIMQTSMAERSRKKSGATNYFVKRVSAAGTRLV